MTIHRRIASVGVQFIVPPCSTGWLPVWKHRSG
jgi:hypothetical protein